MADLTASIILADLANIMGGTPGANVVGTINGRQYTFRNGSLPATIGGMAEQGLTPRGGPVLVCAANQFAMLDVPTAGQTLIAIGDDTWRVWRVNIDPFGATMTVTTIHPDEVV